MKIPQPLSPPEARAIVADMTTWRVVEPGPRNVLAAIDSATLWHVSFWDAMVLTAAIRAGAATVWTVDPNDGQVFDGVEVRDPFSLADNP